MNNIPTLQQLKNTLQANLQSEFNITIPFFGKNFLRALAAVIGGALWLLYKVVGNVQKNLFVDTCDWDTLLRYGKVRLGRYTFAATQGKYTAQVNGNIGATIDAGTIYKSNDNSANPGKLFILDAAYTLVSTTDTIVLRALEAGLDARLAVGDTLTCTQPLNGINSVALVTVETVIPQAAEDIEEYRLKVIQSFRLEPQGGAGADYRIWGLDAQGTRQIYPYTVSGQPNEINVYVEATINDSVDGRGTPTTTILNAVNACIEEDPDVTLPPADRKRRPIGVFMVNVLPVTVYDIDITINGYVGIDAEKQALIDLSLSELIGGTVLKSGVRPFIASCDILSERNDILSINKIIAAIMTAVPGSTFTSVDLVVNSVPVSTYTFDNGRIPFKNSVNYVP